MQAQNIYLAAASVLEEQLRQRNVQDHSHTSVPVSLLKHEKFPSLCPLVMRSRGSTDEMRVASDDLDADLTGSAGERDRQKDLQLTQAMLVFMAMGTWNHRSLLTDSLCMARRIALVVRETCRTILDFDLPKDSWSDWIASEGWHRNTLTAMCFFNLQSIAFNVPPEVHHSEMGHLHLPSPESWWRADSEATWKVARSKEPHHQTTLKGGCLSLFGSGREASQISTSSFGNYVLIHCIIQQIIWSRQVSIGTGYTRSLAPDTLQQLEGALRRWQRNWEATKDSSMDPATPGGPLSFNSIALFRLAYIRMSVDFGPCRQLENRDPVRSIARGFRTAPLLERSPLVSHAVLQCIHSLSILIPRRIGIDFVARTQALTWSIVHSLCNLECALFLAKWLETVATVLSSGETLRGDEERLFGILASIISETDLSREVEQEHEMSKRSRIMATAVLRLWGYTLKGIYVYEMTGTTGDGLDLCASLLQQEIDGTEST